MVDTSKTEHSTLFPSKNIPKNKKPKREVIGSHHGEAIVTATLLLSTTTIVAIVALAVRPPPVAVDALLIRPPTPLATAAATAAHSTTPTAKIDVTNNNVGLWGTQED